MRKTDTNNQRVFARTAMNAELLDAETERDLALRWRDQRDDAALHRLITAHMRLAISIAAKFRRYGAPMADLVQEGSIGLMRAATRFDPDRGIRFSTYARFWIKAEIQEFVMRDWSVVRTGSTSPQKALFFGLRRVQTSIERKTGNAATPAEIRQGIADELGVPLRDVEQMQGRMAGGDFSLNAPQGPGEGRDWLDAIVDPAEPAEDAVGRRFDTRRARTWLVGAFDELTDREREIVIARRLADTPATLATLGQKFSVSRERIRQIEAQSLRKIRNRLERDHGHAARDLVRG